MLAWIDANLSLAWSIGFILWGIMVAGVYAVSFSANKKVRKK